MGAPVDLPDFTGGFFDGAATDVDDGAAEAAEEALGVFEFFLDAEVLGIGGSFVESHGFEPFFTNAVEVVDINGEADHVFSRHLEEFWWRRDFRY